jgi:Kef-type K+ transport system membrane component KefB
MVAALVNGESVREAFIVDVLMNTHGLMELIVINVGCDLGIIPRNVCFMLGAWRW